MKKELLTNVTRVTDKEKELIEHIRKFTTTTTSTKPIKYSKKDMEMYFVLPDPHYPFQNQKLMKKVHQCILDNNPIAGVCISGDWLDLFTLGSYNANSLGLLRDISLDEEYESGLKGIEELERVLPEYARRMFLYGNHEDRYFRELNKRDNAKYGRMLQHPTEALKLEELGYEVKTNWKDDYFTIGDLDITHGVYFNIHCAKKHLEMHGNNIMFGHTHRIQTHYTGNGAGYNIGTLCDLTSNAFGYMPRMTREQWSNGFAVVTVYNGKSYVETIPVRNNQFIFRNRVY